MGTLNSVDVINQHYELQLDLFESSYASLCAETIDRSMEENEVSKYNYDLLQFVFSKINEGTPAQLMSVIVLLKICLNLDSQLHLITVQLPAFKINQNL